jgi:hypothetical protein
LLLLHPYAAAASDVCWWELQQQRSPALCQVLFSSVLQQQLQLSAP